MPRPTHRRPFLRTLRTLPTLAALFTLIIGALAAGRGVADDVLPATFARLLDEHRIPPSAISIEVGAMDDQAVLLRYNAHIPRNPASLIKLPTTLAALELLGPGHQWHTEYLADGEIVDGVLQGDLILRGGGDPFVSVERLLGHILALRQGGLETIAGDLVIDNSGFAPRRHDRGAFDGKSQRVYNVGPDAALLNFSATRFVIEPRGGRIRVRAEPPLAGLKIVNRIESHSGRCIDADSGWSYRIERAGGNLTARFHGSYRHRCGSHSIHRSILPNDEYAYRLFTALWRALGGEFDGGYRVRRAPGGFDHAQVLLRRPSEPLADVIAGINKFSNNAMSRQLLLTLGAHVSGQPGTAEAGASAIHDWLTANGVSMPDLVIDNGAGLSRKSRASAAGLWALLRHGWASTYRPEFVSSLPLAAIDGTMRKRLTDTPLRARARVKTGLINGVRNMAGYVHARNGRHYAVVMMIDSEQVNFHNGNVLQDAMLRWVYELPQ